MPTNDTQDYLVGATVVLEVRVSARNTRVPKDANTLVLDLLMRASSGQSAVVIDLGGTPPFERVSEGYYEYRLDTTGFLPGVYVWRAVASDGSPTGVAMKEDAFVLGALAA